MHTTIRPDIMTEQHVPIFYVYTITIAVAWRHRTENGHTPDMLSIDQFTESLHSALDHLYDPSKLRANPLTELLEAKGSPDTPFVLRKVLSDAIESLRPEPHVPSQAPIWRTYHILSFRYVQRFSQKEVADQLGLSVRQLRRQQQAAVGLLASRVRARFGLGEERLEPTGSLGVEAAAAPDAEAALSKELAWVYAASQGNSAKPARVVAAACDLVEGLSEALNVPLHSRMPGYSLPDVAIHPTALQEALLSIVTIALHRAYGGHVELSAHLAGWQVQLAVKTVGARPGPDQLEDSDPSDLDMAQRLVKMSGGSLTVHTTRDEFAAGLALPGVAQVPILAIDDSEDALRLFTRYVSGTRYRIIGTRDPTGVFSLAAETPPCAVILDVMMPAIDGWELLGRLKTNPLTNEVPIIVCTIMPRKELAASLGADQFLSKPVTRQAFLDALDDVCSRERVSR